LIKNLGAYLERKDSIGHDIALILIHYISSFNLCKVIQSVADLSPLEESIKLSIRKEISSTGDDLFGIDEISSDR